MNPDAIKKPFALTSGKFIIGSVSERGVSFSAKPVEHNTWDEARAEALRLARVNAGHQYTVMEVRGSVVFGGELWS